MAKCISPIYLKKEAINVPCGRCQPCKLRRISAWSFRLNKEAERSDSAFFLTLTYDNDHIPISKNGFMTLHKDQRITKKGKKVYWNHLQTFFKLLRYHNGKTDKPIKYYAVGEYGGETHRPHYHIIIFNCKLSTLIGQKLATQHKYGTILLNGETPYNCKSWQCGHITVGEFTEGSVGYTLKYICKDPQVGKFSRDDRVPEYSLMSKKLGENYLTDNMKRYHLNDLENRLYCTTNEGIKLSMPRYFKDKIYSKYQRNKIAQHYEKKEAEDYQKLTDKAQIIHDQRELNKRIYYAKQQGVDKRNTKL